MISIKMFHNTLVEAVEALQGGATQTAASRLALLEVSYIQVKTEWEKVEEMCVSIFGHIPPVKYILDLKENLKRTKAEAVKYFRMWAEAKQRVAELEKEVAALKEGCFVPNQED